MPQEDVIMTLQLGSLRLRSGNPAVYLYGFSPEGVRLTRERLPVAMS